MELTSLFIIFFYVLSAQFIPIRCIRSDCRVESKNLGPGTRTNTTQKLIWLRNEMHRAAPVRSPALDAFIVSSYDEHQGEFPAERDKRLGYISGFSGSFGFAVITKSKAAFWTDSENYELADRQLDCNWILMGLETKEDPSLTEWLKTELKPGYRVGADPKSIPFGLWEEWTRGLGSARIGLIETYNDLIDLTWTIGRPPYGAHSAFVLPPKYAGVPWQNKIKKLRKILRDNGCDAMIVTALEEIAWLLNIRGRDVPFNPFVRSYLIVTETDLHWYVPLEKIGDSVKKQLMIDTYFNGSSVRFRAHAYHLFFSDARTISQSSKKVLIPSSCAYSPGASRAVFSAVPPDKRFLRPSPVIFMKAKKNQAELEGMRKANLRDSATLADFLSDLEEKIRNGSVVTETSVAKSLDTYRSIQNSSRGIPFPTFAAFAENGAIFRRPRFDSISGKRVDDSSLLLLHGGGHYYDGTSDVTRTFHFGTPTKRMVEDYTRLLTGFIGLSTAVFPMTIKLTELDAILRSKLWKYGMDYLHDTCHGIGTFSTAKESPILINHNDVSSREGRLEEGYFLTCEPGFYRKNEYGIRLGNVMQVIRKFPVSNETRSEYLGFELLTLFPFEPRLVDFKKLSESEIEWLNDYNRRVAAEIGPELGKRSKKNALRWLSKKTKASVYQGRCSSSASGFILPISFAAAINLNFLLIYFGTSLVKV